MRYLIFLVHLFVVDSMQKCDCEDSAMKNQLDEMKQILLGLVKAVSECQIADMETKDEKEDPKVLLIGPGHHSDGFSEVLSLPDLTPLDCYMPAFPGTGLLGSPHFLDSTGGRYHSYVGRTTSDGVLMCGGDTGSGYSHVTSSCHLLTSSGYQELPGLNTKRAKAASVVTQLGLWVTGGYDGKQHLDTTEIWSNGRSKPHVRLPSTLQDHCLTPLNTTHVLLTGGEKDWSAIADAFIYSEEDGFIQIEDMKTPRNGHACYAIDDNTVLVAGGSYDKNANSTEILDLTSLTWSPGPAFPDQISILEWVSVNMIGPAELGQNMKDHLLIGEEKIFKLEKGEGLAKTSRWTEIGEMRYVKRDAQAFVLNKSVLCKN